MGLFGILNLHSCFVQTCENLKQWCPHLKPSLCVDSIAQKKKEIVEHYTLSHLPESRVCENNCK